MSSISCSRTPFVRYWPSISYSNLQNRQKIYCFLYKKDNSGAGFKMVRTRHSNGAMIAFWKGPGTTILCVVIIALVYLLNTLELYRTPDPIMEKVVWALIVFAFIGVLHLIKLHTDGEVPWWISVLSGIRGVLSGIYEFLVWIFFLACRVVVRTPEGGNSADSRESFTRKTPHKTTPTVHIHND